MTDEQFDALLMLIRSEAEYAANEVMNRNGCAESLRRSEVERSVKAILVTNRSE